MLRARTCVRVCEVRVYIGDSVATSGKVGAGKLSGKVKKGERRADPQLMCFKYACASLG